MSRVIQQAKKKYKMVLSIEFIILLASLFLLTFWQWKIALSFSLGIVAIFLPYCLFVWVVFFTKNQQLSNKITSFYRGEAIKFVSTIVLIVLAFRLYADMHIMAFFTGYFIAIILNNILPFLVSKYLKHINFS